MALPATPKITWDAAFAKTITFSGPVDVPTPVPLVRGAYAEAGSGVRDKWVQRTDAELEIIVRNIPRNVSSSVTGYSDASTGWYAFLQWADSGNSFRYFPDATSGSFHLCDLIDHDANNDVKFEQGGAYRRIRLRLRDTTGTQFSEY